MSLSRNKNSTKGFTLIEMMVALSLFTIVVTIAVGAFLSLIGSSKGVQSEQSVMATLTFVLDSMSREIRTGTEYYCSNTNFLNQESIMKGKNCLAAEKGGISFIEAGSSLSTSISEKRIAYYYDSATQSIFRRIGNADPAESIVSKGIKITNAEFFVTGTERFSENDTDTIQPTVTIILEAEDELGATTVLQTTVTQRELDI